MTGGNCALFPVLSHAETVNGLLCAKNRRKIIQQEEADGYINDIKEKLFCNWYSAAIVCQSMALHGCWLVREQPLTKRDDVPPNSSSSPLAVGMCGEHDTTRPAGTEYLTSSRRRGEGWCPGSLSRTRHRWDCWVAGSLARWPNCRRHRQHSIRCQASGLVRSNPAPLVFTIL